MNQTADEIIIKTGNPPSFNHGPKILWWKHERPEVYKNISAFVMPASYVVMRLCGLKAGDAFIDRTYLHFSGFADNKNSCWDDGLLNYFKVDKSKMPRIVSSTDIIGNMTGKMAERCGLPAPIPVAAGCGDTAASFLSCGAVKPGICVDVAGTASVFAATTDTFSCDTATKVLGCSASATEGLWHPYAYINGGGMNIEWFLSGVMGRERKDPGRFNGMETAELSPKDSDPMFIPHMEGRVSPSQPALKGTFAGLRWNHSYREMYMAILESVALEYGIYRNSLEKMYKSVKMNELRITGGGENSRIWKKMKSGALQVPVVSIEHNYGAPMGAAMIAGVASGVFKSTVEASGKWISIRDEVRCGENLYPYYQKRISRYEFLIENMNRFYSEIED